MASYHSEYNEEKGVLKTAPVHDWASHPADAMQTLALAHSFRGAAAKVKPYVPPVNSRGSWMGV
ncbi:MAG: hypothetical protein WBQ36_02365 [Desulfobaccales bacterium]